MLGETLREPELLRTLLSNVASTEPCVRAVLLFGSMARGETLERSDIDLLVLHKNCGVKDPVLRRRRLYHLIHEALGGTYKELTVLDMEVDDFLKPKIITPLLLNIYWDAQVILDKTGTLQPFLECVKKRIVEHSLRRVKDGRSYYWILPKPMEKVELL